MLKKFGVLLAVMLLAMSLAACSVEKTEEGELPDVDVEGGKLPEYDVDTADIDVGTQTTTVTVPDVDVSTQTTTVATPDVDITMPAEKASPTPQ